MELMGASESFWAIVNVVVTVVCLIGIFVAYRVATRHYRNCDGKCGRRF